VDGFQYTATAKTHTFFLSHFHSDHYQGITPKWRGGVIYSTVVTSRLLLHTFQLPLVVHPALAHMTSFCVLPRANLTIIIQTIKHDNDRRGH
jgi:ribonuclease BN (tRNA processing enzyme)